MKKITSIALLGSLMLLIAACATPPKVAVEERSVLNARQEAEKIGGHLIRIVQPGDTLHAIAFVTNLDVNRVAAWNGIDDTAKLRVGQRIRLTEPIGFVYAKPKRDPEPAAAQVVKTSPIVVTDLPGQNARPRSNAQTSKPAMVPKVNSPVDKPSVVSTQTSRNVRFAWHWPTRGVIVGGFSISKGQQGIDIKAQKGQAVMAAGGGEVVYVGNSLKGYGNLVIIKHNESYLSAYAHNDSIFVSEGQRITAKQKIGTVGLNKQRVSALHFQIRKNGKPVNPINYLPKI